MISDKDKLDLIKAIVRECAECGMDTGDEYYAAMVCIEVIANFEGGNEDGQRVH